MEAAFLWGLGLGRSSSYSTFFDVIVVGSSAWCNPHRNGWEVIAHEIEVALEQLDLWRRQLDTRSP